MPGSAECALQLVEEALVRAVSLVVGEALELLQQAALLVGESARDSDIYEHALVSATEALQDRHPPAPKYAHLAGLRSGLELKIERPVECLDRHGCSERRLDDGQVYLGEDVVSLAHEPLVGSDSHGDVDVARAATERADVTLPRESDALPVVDPGRNLDRQLPLLERPARARARL